MSKSKRDEGVLSGGSLKLEPITLNIGNVCRGAVPEAFDNAMSKILENVADGTTPADAPRSLMLKFDFTPSLDRKSAMASLSVKLKLASPEAKGGEIFFGRGTILAEDPRQNALFPAAAEAQPKPQ